MALFLGFFRVQHVVLIHQKNLRGNRRWPAVLIPSRNKKTQQTSTAWLSQHILKHCFVVDRPNFQSPIFRQKWRQLGTWTQGNQALTVLLFQARNLTPSSSDVAPLNITARPCFSKATRAFLNSPSSMPKKSCQTKTSETKGLLNYTNCQICALKFRQVLQSYHRTSGPHRVRVRNNMMERSSHLQLEAHGTYEKKSLINRPWTAVPGNLTSGYR